MFWAQENGNTVALLLVQSLEEQRTHWGIHWIFPECKVEISLSASKICWVFESISQSPEDSEKVARTIEWSTDHFRGTLLLSFLIYWNLLFKVPIGDLFHKKMTASIFSEFIFRLQNSANLHTNEYAFFGAFLGLGEEKIGTFGTIWTKGIFLGNINIRNHQNLFVWRTLGYLFEIRSSSHVLLTVVDGTCDMTTLNASSALTHS